MSWNATYSIKAEQCWEVWGFEIMQHVDKLGAVHSIAGSKHTSREHTELKKLCNGLTLGRFWKREIITQMRNKSFRNKAPQKAHNIMS